MNKLAKSLYLRVFATFISFILSTSLTNPSPNIGETRDSNNIGAYFKALKYFEEKGFYSTDFNTLPITLPFEQNKVHRISSYFGEFRRLPVVHYHKGVDFAGELNSPIYSSANGTIIRANRGLGYGKVVIIKHENNLKTIYAHLNKIDVAVGDTVIAGQKIGKLGNTGWSTGPHLHYELRKYDIPIDPLVMFKKDSTISYEDVIERATHFKTLFDETFSKMSNNCNDTLSIAG